MAEPTPLRDSTIERLQARLAAEQRDCRLPSIVGGIVRGGTLAWFGAAGFVGEGEAPTPDTQYRIGSITKTMTAVAIMRLRDEGLLNLNDDIATHAPGAPTGMTIAQLLAHTGGLQSETNGLWWERVALGDFSSLAHSLTSDAVKHDPGSRFHYSNLGFGILGRIIANLRDTSWDDVVTQEVLLPLGMDRSTMRPAGAAAQGYSVHPHADLMQPQPQEHAGALAAAGQVWSSLQDLARWAAFLGGHLGEVLAPDTFLEMLEPRSVVDVPDKPWTGAMGLGIQISNLDGTRLVGHGGSMPGFIAQVMVEQESGLGIVFATNSTSGVSGTLVEDLRAIVNDGEPPPSVDPWRPDATQTQHLDLVGTWYWGPRAYTLRLTGNGEFHLGPVGLGRASIFERVDDDTWLGRDEYYAGETLRVHRDQSGAPRHLDLASFILTRQPYDPADVQPGGADPRGWLG